MNSALEAADWADVSEPAFLKRIRLRARRRAFWIRAQGNAPNAGWEGGAIPHAQVDRILASAELGAEAENAFYGKDPIARQLTSAIKLADLQFRSEEPWLSLSGELGLSQYELDLLSLLAAPEIDPMLQRAYGYLNDDAAAQHPTPWLAACLFGWPSGIRFTPHSPIIAWRLARPADGVPCPWSLNTPWIIDAFAVTWLCGEPLFDPQLAGALLFTDQSALPSLCAYPAEMAAMQGFIEALHCEPEQRVQTEPRPRIEICLIGASGSGKKTLIAQLCKVLGRKLAVADAGLLLAPDIPLQTALDNAVRVNRLARLSGAAIHWRNADSIGAQLWRVWPRSSAGDLTLFSAHAPLPAHAQGNAIWRSFAIPPLDCAGRIAVWSEHTSLPVPDPVANRLVTPAEIVSAARAAPAGPRAIAEACHHSLHAAAAELLDLLPCPYTWGDIVLEPGVRHHLAELEAQARLRWRVYEEWGFAKLCPLGKGITAMFAGPSGTGKTMAGQVLARSLGMELYRIDLAGVVNKYIGETEKRLKQVFSVCERANVLLFFDEADALFGQRTRVKDAHDRYANIEIDYLLQRMEQFDGVAILATNRKNDIDSAFLRRIRFVVDFLPPGPAERLALWRLSLLAAAANGEPLLDEIDWDFLANKLVMTGADIKSAAISAAFLACDAGTRIGMQHILHAARREMIKRGSAHLLAE